MKKLANGGLFLLVFLLIPLIVSGRGEATSDLERDYLQNSRRAAPQDAFPVLHNPDMMPASEADQHLEDSSWVIGIEKNSEAKAYPVSVMGVHELANDRVGGHPIAIGW